jgi:hypothetical protein
MVTVTSMPDPSDEGYPLSTKADLDPGPDLNESLDDADRMASDEHRVVPKGQRPDASTADEDRLEDAEDGDNAESRQ